MAAFIQRRMHPHSSTLLSPLYSSPSLFCQGLSFLPNFSLSPPPLLSRITLSRTTLQSACLPWIHRVQNHRANLTAGHVTRPLIPQFLLRLVLIASNVPSSRLLDYSPVFSAPRLAWASVYVWFVRGGPNQPSTSIHSTIHYPIVNLCKSAPGPFSVPVARSIAVCLPRLRWRSCADQ